MQYPSVPLLCILALCLTACGDDPASYQGYVEGEFLGIGAEESGRVTQLHVREGDEMAAGDLLFDLDDTTARADVAAARTVLMAAEATLRDLESGARQPEIEALMARREQAEASLELSRIQFTRQERLVESGARPPEMLDEARAALERDQARIAEITKDIEVARLGSRINQIEVARQDMESARAELEKAEWRLDQRSVEAPAAGQVSEIVSRPGEVVSAGRPVVTMLPPANLKVRFFVPQADMARLGRGDAVSITCDGCPSPVPARVSFVSSEVEFTPPVIFSDQSREKLVVMVEARPEEPVDFLRPGQPVDVTRRDVSNETTADQ